MAYRTMLAKVGRGELPAEKPGKEWRLRRADMDAFIEKSRVKRGEVKAAPRRSRGAARQARPKGGRTKTRRR